MHLLEYILDLPACLYWEQLSTYLYFILKYPLP